MAAQFGFIGLSWDQWSSLKISGGHLEIIWVIKTQWRSVVAIGAQLRLIELNGAQ